MSSNQQGSIGSMVMTEIGLANEIGGGKVRWRTIQETQKASLVTSTGTSVLSLCASADSEWLAYGRRNNGVFVFKLRGGSGAEIALPNSNSMISSTITALCIHNSSKSKSSIYRIIAGDQHGVLASWLIKDEHSTINQPQIIAKDLGSITAIIQHSEEIFVATKDGVKLVRLEMGSGGVLEEYPSCPSPPIRLLCISSHLNYILVGSQHRHVAAYSLDSGSPVFLSGESAPVHIDVSPFIWEQDYQHVLAVNELGDVSIWKFTSTTSKKPILPAGKIKLDSASIKQHSILRAAFSRTHKNSVIVAYGSALQSNFANLIYVDENSQIIPKQTLSSNQTNALLNGTTSSSTLAATSSSSFQKESKSKDGPRIAGAHDMPVSQSSFKGSDAIQANPLSSDDMQVDSDSFPQDPADVPFSQLVSRAKKSTARDSTPAKSELPVATSAVGALVSALSANDRAQLGLLLSRQDERFIASTIRQLPVSQVLPLLTELLSQFSSKASVPIIAWTRQLLIIHQSYLASAPDLLTKLSGLYNTVDQRLQNFNDLLKLSGRFDLLLAHIRDEDENHTQANRALQTYIEAEDDSDLENPDSSEADSDALHHSKNDSDSDISTDSESASGDDSDVEM